MINVMALICRSYGRLLKTAEVMVAMAIAINEKLTGGGVLVRIAENWNRGKLGVTGWVGQVTML